MSTIANKLRKQQGFTLVELAIVMIIIGLLIAGILKGQELIANARVTSTVAQVKGIDAATTTFQDKYNALPGDMQAANNRLQNCAGACVPASNGNGLVDLGAGFAAVPTVEALAFFIHLSAADLLSGIDPTQLNVWGGNFPKANIAGGFHASFLPGGVAGAVPNIQGMTNANVRSGHYLALHNAPAAGVGPVGVITPNQAFRIDAKLDDGVPNSGSVFPGGAGGCIRVAAAYNENTDVASCNLYIRFHQ